MIFIFILLANQGWAAQEEKFTYCRLGKIVRMVRTVEDPENQGCMTIYTKSGVDRTIGSGKFWQSCYDFQDNIKKNLEEAGWKCRIVENVEIVSEPELAEASQAQ